MPLPEELVNRNVERGRSTRDQLVDVALRLFTENGYDGTSIEAVLAESGVSRGALYHHFAGKDALFGAVLTRVQEQVGATLAEEARDAPDLLAGLRIGCLGFLRLAGERSVQQVMLIDAPAVLGWELWRALDEQHTLGDMKTVLAAAAEQGRLDPRHAEMFAHIVLAAVNEVALVIARAEDQAAALEAGGSAFEEFLDRLLGREVP
jgi:AcrR family transcriptional regulator